MLKGKKVFISCGNGLIGNALVKKLHSNGALLYVGDLKPCPSSWPEDIIYRQGDLNYLTKEELDHFGPEYFFHLAPALPDLKKTGEQTLENYYHDVQLSAHLFSLFKDNTKLKKVIFASDYRVYDPKLYTYIEPVVTAYRLKESDPVYPESFTGLVKLNHETELRMQTRFQAVSARIYNCYGHNSQETISGWIRSLLNKETLTVLKKESLYDYIFAEDVAEGLIRLADHPEANGVYNLGADNARSFEEVLAVLKTHFPDLTYKEEESTGNYEGAQANMDYCVKTLGWKPQQQIETVIPGIIAYEKEKQSAIAKVEKSAVLVTSISKKIGLLKAVKKASNKFGTNVTLIGGDVNKNVTGKHFVDIFWEMPTLKELNAEKIIAYCKNNDVRLIIPTRDGELVFWSKIKPELQANGIAVMISDTNAIEVCLDKLNFYETLNKLNFPAIATAKNIDALTGAERFVVKEQFGAGSLSIGLNLSKTEALEHAKKLESPIFQPYIAGKEVSVDIYIDRTGKTKGVIARSRDEVVNGESQVTTTLNDATLEKLSATMAEKIKLSGHVILQVMVDADKNYHIIECNSRFGGASTLSVNCGLDSFYWALLEASGNDISNYPFLRPGEQRSQIRFPEDIIISHN